MNGRRLPHTQTRCGLTRVEVAVVLICLFLVIVLIVPGIFLQRETQRTTACQQRIGTLSQALFEYASAHNTRFPALVEEKTPWTQAILPHLQETHEFVSRITNDPIDQQSPIPAPLFLCPNGQQYEPGRNCYIVNGGWGEFEVDPQTGAVRETALHTIDLDWDKDGTVTQQEREWTRATGVFWRGGTSWSLDEIRAATDGSVVTLLLSETQNSRSWMSLQTFDLAFVVGRDYFESPNELAPFAVHTDSLGPYAVNSSRGGKLGHCPAPSSLHPKGVNVLLADGSVRTLSDKIDPLVYLHLMTPDGNRYGEFQAYDPEFELKPIGPENQPAE